MYLIERFELSTLSFSFVRMKDVISDQKNSASDLKTFRKCFLSVRFYLCEPKEKLILKFLSFLGMKALFPDQVYLTHCVPLGLCARK